MGQISPQRVSNIYEKLSNKVPELNLDEMYLQSIAELLRSPCDNFVTIVTSGHTITVFKYLNLFHRGKETSIKYALCIELVQMDKCSL